MNNKYSARSYRYAWILAACLGSVAAQAQWTPVGGANGISAAAGSYLNLTQDKAGHFYVAYYDSSVSKGSIQQYDGTAWTYVGGSAGITGGGAAYNCVAVDTSGKLFYSFQDATSSNKISVQQYGNSSLTGSWPAISAGGAYFNSMKISATNTPYLVYRDITLSSNLVAKKFDGTNWVGLGTPAFASLLSYYPSLVTGSNDSVYVSSVTALSAIQVFKIHAQATGTTAWEPVGTTGFPTSSTLSIAQSMSSMAIDASNRLYLAYGSNTAQGNKLNVKKYENGQWSSVGADNFSAGSASFISIAVTPSGTPYVAFSDGSNAVKATTVMKFDGTQWVTVGNAGISNSTATWNSLILDANDNPVVAFADAGNGGAVKVMRFVPAVDSVVVGTQNNAPAAITTNAGTLQMTATIFPAGADQSVTWSIVPGSGAAAISATGLVTAQSNGTVFAKAVSVSDPTKMDSLELNISNQIVAGVANVGFTRAVSVYPTPFRDRVTIEIKGAGTSSYQLAVTNQLGTLIRRASFTGSRYELDLSSLPGGMYFLNLSGQEGTAGLKLLKE